MERPRLLRRRSLGITIVCILVVTLAPIGIASYAAFIRPPVNAPEDVCGEATATPSVVTAGASIVQGTLGANWVASLQNRPEFAGHQFVNAGISGNTSSDLRARVDADIVACRPDAVMILVGTNDVRNEVAIPEYAANLGAIIDRIRGHTTARIALMSLPPLGEDLDSEINRTLSDYNAAIRRLAARPHVDYLPVHEHMVEILGQRTDRPAHDFSVTLAFSAATQHYVLGRSWDDIADSSGLELLIDHIHLSDRGASVITELAEPWLATVEPTPPPRIGPSATSTPTSRTGSG